MSAVVSGIAEGKRPMAALRRGLVGFTVVRGMVRGMFLWNLEVVPGQVLRCHTDAPGGSWSSGYAVRVAVALTTPMECELLGVYVHHPAQKNLGKRAL